MIDGWSLQLHKKEIYDTNSPSIFLSCSILCYCFHKYAEFLQTLVSSHSHSYDTDPKSIVSWWQKNCIDFEEWVKRNKLNVMIFYAYSVFKI